MREPKEPNKENYMYLKESSDRKEFTTCVEEECTHICIPISEYNGYRKAVRIVTDRALQQIDKSEADGNGFRLLRAEKRYCREYDGMLWYVVKQTPHSLKIPSMDALEVSVRTLREQFKFIDDVDLGKFYLDSEISEMEKNAGKVMVTRISGQLMPKAAEQWSDEVFRSERDFLVQNNVTGRALYRAFAQFEGLFIIGIAGISQNYAQGVYEISYWATAAI